AAPAAKPMCYPPRPGICLSFPHSFVTACYGKSDGLLVFGPTSHCVSVRANLRVKSGGPAFPGKPVQMGPPWWIIQFKAEPTFPVPMPTGEVILVVQDAVDQTAKPKIIDFLISGDCPQ